MNNDTKTEEINIKVENIINTLKEILGSNKNTKSEEDTNREIEEICKAEKETGGTSHIKDLVKDIETHEISENKKVKKSRILKTKNSSSKEFETQEQNRETGNVLEDR